ncbi:MAG: hypothetical protein NW206_04430 [Hyphomonadaceae bacterium]|nr:hypothetical protein [Hyphomonadaceae bacterium]
MSVEAFGLRAEIALSIAMLMLGAVMALTSGNAVKRVAGVLVAQIGAVLAAGVLLGGDILIVGVALMVATFAIAAALIVRAQERYHSVEMRDLDKADIESEPPEPSAS